jgi:hypothetical protein
MIRTEIMEIFKVKILRFYLQKLDFCIFLTIFLAVELSLQALKEQSSSQSTVLGYGLATVLCQFISSSLVEEEEAQRTCLQQP